MTLPLEIDPLLLASSSYTVSRSVRLRSSASAYLTRTIGTPTSAVTWTWSGWVKRGTLGVTQQLFGSFAASSTSFGGLQFAAGDGLTYTDYTTVVVGQLVTSAVYRDPSAWYHIVLVYDAGNATASNRIRLYVNGVQVTSFSSATYPGLNNTSFWNNSSFNPMNLGTLGFNNARVNFFDGYLAEVNFIDGQALTPSSFGTTDSNGIWQPKAYTGTYGTNGFYLKFTDNSAATAAAIGKDYSGNGNNWTPNNISVTAGNTYDSMIDSPTVGAGASNYCVMNPLVRTTNNTGSISQADGNLSTSIGSYANTALGTIGVTSGKWYWEMIPTATNNGAYFYIGVAAAGFNNAAQPTADALQWAYYAFSGNKMNNSNVAYGATYTTNDVIGVALDMINGTLTFYKNGTTQGQAFSNLAGYTIFPMCSFGNTGSITVVSNFGQRPFTYTPPSGFAALNTYNLPAATINNGATVMAASTYTGTGATQSIVNSGNNAAAVSFKPDLLWIKARNNVSNNALQDSVRGVTNQLSSNLTAAEITAATEVTSFNANGFSLSTDSTVPGYTTNASTYTYIAWQWQAGQGTTSSNTNGSITSTVSVNQSAGFSVVTWTNVSGGTIGHGLGVAPSLIIVKERGVAGGNWGVYSKVLGAGQAVQLNTTVAAFASTTIWNNTSPTSSVFSIGSPWSATTMVAYCWSEVAGYSKFGSYTGNGSTDGPFVYCGFRPRFILFKITSAVGNWFIRDTSRDTYNAGTQSLYPNLSDAEFAGAALDILSNGFKPRASASGLNGSGETIIYAAFAENPFTISRAR